MIKRVSIIDYGMSNLLSISRAFEHVGAEVQIVDSPDSIRQSDYLVLPGVGAFPDGMTELNTRHLSDSIREFALSGRPLLGVCLGMQMLLGQGHEHTLTQGLNIIDGEVLPLPKICRVLKFQTSTGTAFMHPKTLTGIKRSCAIHMKKPVSILFIHILQSQHQWTMYLL